MPHTFFSVCIKKTQSITLFASYIIPPTDWFLNAVETHIPPVCACLPAKSSRAPWPRRGTVAHWKHKWGNVPRSWNLGASTQGEGEREREKVLICARSNRCLAPRASQKPTRIRRAALVRERIKRPGAVLTAPQRSSDGDVSLKRSDWEVVLTLSWRSSDRACMLACHAVRL